MIRRPHVWQGWGPDTAKDPEVIVELTVRDLMAVLCQCEGIPVKPEAEKRITKFCQAVRRDLDLPL